MIGLVYGYYVKHGGIGRYLSGVLENYPIPKELGLITLETNIPIPEGIAFEQIICERDTKFFSFNENFNFSEKVSNISHNYEFLHSHGIYSFIPRLYTAHICLKSYFDRIKDFFGEDNLPKDHEEVLKLEEKMITQVPVLTAVSKKVAEEIVDNYSRKKEEITIVRGASRFKLGDNLGNREKIKKINLGFIGGNISAKGLPFVVSSVNELVSKGYVPTLTVAGENEDIIRYLKDNAKFDFKTFGKVNLEQDFYRSLDVLMCLSIYEGYSLSTLEAMSLGVPVVSSNLNGALYDNPHNELPRVKDITDVGNIVKIMERIFQDLDYRDKIVKEGLIISSNDSWSNIAQFYNTLYNKIRREE